MSELKVEFETEDGNKAYYIAFPTLLPEDSFAFPDPEGRFNDNGDEPKWDESFITKFYRWISNIVFKWNTLTGATS